MAEVIAIVSSVFGCVTVVVTLVSPCLREPLSEGYNLFRKRKERLETLRTKLTELEQRCREVERQSKDKVLSKCLKVSEWLQKADKFIVEANGSNFGVRIGEINCFGLPNYGSQYKAGKEIEQRIGQLDALQKDGKKFINMEESYVVGQMKCSIKLAGKAASKVDKIKKYVTGKAVSTILVYGMAGSGKTEIVSAVNDHILIDYKNYASSSEGIDNSSTGNSTKAYFDKVIWVTVENKGSNQSSIENLQKKIAEKLQIDFNKATGNKAHTLESALKELRFLIILDDMWKKLSLEEIGIPRPTKENCCKVIIVSRSLPVCSDINIDKKVEIKPLSGPEAQDMFESEAGIKLSDLKEDTRETAKQMIYECEGLPLAIVLLAQTLKEVKNDDSVDDVAWNAAVDKLKSSPARLEGMNEKAFNRLKDSYDMLKDEAKQCFLYCALYPSGHHMNKKKLVEYWFWEGLLDGKERSGRIEDMTQAKEILDELIGAYLVEAVVRQEDSKECIKMRNLVRHMAVHLTKTGPGRFLIKAEEKLNHIPLQGEHWSEVQRASLMRNQFKALTEEPKFHKLSTLLLQHNPIYHLHDNFFRNMPNIEVLDLSHTHIRSLPKSASYLTKLRALLLRDCHYLKSLPPLANSKELLILDLSNTLITKLPDGMKELTKLIRLNLSRTSVGEFQAEFVRALVNLEELYFMITNDSAGSLWGSAKGASIQELGALPNLAILHINFLDAEAFNRYVVSKNHPLSKFKFCVGGSCDETKLSENSIVFIKSDFLVKGKPVLLPEDTSELHVMRNVDLRRLKVASCLNSLKVINMSSCVSLVYLFEINMLYNLPNLETISVEKCQKMEGLIESKGHSGDVLQFQAPPHSKHLKVIRISDCENLVYLFRIEMLPYFPNLQEISIRRRQSKEVDKESKEAKEPGSGASSAIDDSRLQELVLVAPLELNKIYGGEMKSNSDEQTIWTFPELKMRIITSLLHKPSVPKVLMKRNRSFGSLSRRVSGKNDDKEVLPHSAQLTPAISTSTTLKGIEYLQSNLDTDNEASNISRKIRNLLYAIATFICSVSLLQKLLNPSVPNPTLMMQKEPEENVTELTQPASSTNLNVS